MNSRDKGQRGERELAKVLQEAGYAEARRGQQFHGGPDSPDVVGALPGFHIECKWVERLNLRAAMAQAIRDSAGSATPIVCHKTNRCEWLVTIQLTDFLRIVHAREDKEEF